MSFIARPSDRDSRRISAQSSTPNTSSSPARSRARVDGSTPRGADPRERVRIRPSIRGHYSGVADTRAFYESLGWSVARQPDNKVCFFRAGGMVFGLWTALGDHGAPGIELAHNVRTPEKVTEVLTEAERAGGSIVRHTAAADWGGTSGAFADPDGYVWEVAHNPGWRIDTDGTIHI